MKQWELKVELALTSWGMTFSYSNVMTPCSTHRIFPDYVFLISNHVVILEVDENYHRNYAIECEVARMGKLKDNLLLPLHLIRFHPSLGRLEALRSLLESLFARPTDEASGVEVFYMGYPQERVDALLAQQRESEGAAFKSNFL